MSKDYYLEIEKGEKLILPSEKQNTPTSLQEPTPQVGQSSNVKKFYFLGSIFLLILLVYFFFDFISNSFIELLRQNPTLYSYYLSIKTQIENSTLEGLSYMSILGSIFFLVMPSEALFMYYLNSTHHFFFVILVIMIAGNLVGMIFNYGFGRIIGEGLTRKLFKTSFGKYKQRIEKYGSAVLLIGNILPGPIEVLAVFYGTFKYDFKKYCLYVFIGRMIKFILLFIAFVFFWDQIMIWFDSLVGQIKILGDLYK